MQKYDNNFKEEAVKLSDEIGLAPAANKLGIPYQTLSEWRKKRSRYGERAHVGSGTRRQEKSREEELEEEIKELKKANEILQEALSFFVVRRKK